MGIGTAHSSPVFRGLVGAAGGFVWPSADGTDRGQSLIPLFSGAADLARRNIPLYDLITIIDAARVGTSRIRKIAGDLLAERLVERTP
jgi:hypothetical protein